MFQKSADFWNKGVDWIWDTFFQTLKIFNTWLIVDVLQPMRASYLRMPIVATFVLVMGAGYIIGGIRSAFVVGAPTTKAERIPPIIYPAPITKTNVATIGIRK